MISVSVVKAGAAAPDDLAEQDYLDIFEEVRRKMSLRAFVEFVSSAYSIAWWSKLEAGKAELTRQARLELRKVVGLPPLSPTVGEAMAEVDPDAIVYRVGAGRPDRVLLIGDQEHQVRMRVNGRVEIEPDLPGEDPEPVAAGCNLVTRRERGRISLERPMWERLNEARAAQGMSWAAFLAPLLNVERDG